jgi:hypothetical protein
MPARYTASAGGEAYDRKGGRGPIRVVVRANLNRSTVRQRIRQPTDTIPAPAPWALRSKCGRASTALLSRILPTVIGLFCLSGCYTYAETSLSSLTPGLQARVRLTEDGFGRVVNQAAVSGVPVDMLDLGGRGVVGRVMTLGPSNLTVEMRGAGGSVFTADVPTQVVQEVSVRTFSRGRTIGALVGGAVLFAGLYVGTTGGTTSAPTPPEPEQMNVPVLPFLTRIFSTKPAQIVLGFSARLGSGR